MDEVAIAALVTVYIVLWAYLMIAYFRRIFTTSDFVFTLMFGVINLVIAATALAFSSIPVVVTMGNVCTSNSTLIVTSSNTTTTVASSVCNAVLKPLPYTHLFILPFALFLLNAFIAFLATILALVRRSIRYARAK